jgi:hypothetical protein
MMRRREEEIKGELSPLNPVSRRFCKSPRDRESVKHPSEKGKTQAGRGATGNGFIIDRQAEHGREVEGDG